MMSRKHYQTAADVIATERARIMTSNLTPVARGTALLTTSKIAYGLADMFTADNERFNRDRFLDAAGVTE